MKGVPSVMRCYDSVAMEVEDYLEPRSLPCNNFDNLDAIYSTIIEANETSFSCASGSSS